MSEEAGTQMPDIAATGVLAALETNFKGLDADAPPLGDDNAAFIRSMFSEDPPAEEKPAEEAAATDEKPVEEAAAAAEKPAEEKPADEAAAKDEPASDDKRSHDWRQLKEKEKATAKERDDFRAKAGELQKKLDELAAQAAELPDLREKAKYVEEAEKELAIARVEGTREYKEHVEAPLKAIVKTLDVIAKSADVDSGKLLRAAYERDPEKRRAALKEITADMDDADRGDVREAVRDAQAILVKEDAIYAKAEAAAKEAKSVQEARASEESRRAKAEFKAAAALALDELGKRMPFDALVPAGQDVEGFLAATLAKVEASDTASVGVKAFSTTAGILLPRVNEALKAANAKVKTLEARVSELTSQGASADAGAAAAAEVDPTKGEPFEDIAKLLGTPGMVGMDVLGRLKSV
ncbi:MAG: hypothetical protein WC718_00135 [Phycisphaerales bacterium]|jgi:hypothetical protein